MFLRSWRRLMPQANTAAIGRRRKVQFHPWSEGLKRVTFDPLLGSDGSRIIA